MASDLLSSLHSFLAANFCDETSLVIHYGSSLTKHAGWHDVDLLVVEFHNRRLEQARFGMLDLTVIGRNELSVYVDDLDPAVAAGPILTGKLILGPTDEWIDLHEQLKLAATADPSARLVERAAAILADAASFLSAGYLQEACENIRFSSSMINTWIWYQENRTLELPEVIDKQINAAGIDLTKAWESDHELVREHLERVAKRLVKLEQNSF